MPITSPRFGARPASSSRLVGELIGEEAKRRGATQEVKRRSILDYAMLVPEANTGPLRLEDFPFQIEPFYTDEIADAEEVVYVKSTQVGASTGLWRWAVRLADQDGETVIYFFPAKEHVTDFGDERIEPSIEASEYLQRRMPAGGTRRKTLKEIGNGKLSLRGMNSRKGVQSIAGQAIVFDEYDDCDPSNISQAERRISGAKQLGKTPRIRRAGRPSIPGYGIDAAYQESDQRQWFVRCPECNDEQTVEFAANLRWRSHVGGDKVLRAGRDEFELKGDVLEAWRACRSCEASLEGPPLLGGRWKATATGPGRVPGFHIPRLIVATTDLKQIIEASRETKIAEIETFHNADLGRAWAAADALLTDADLERACAQGGDIQYSYAGRYPVTLGLDVASERDLSCRISEHTPTGERKALRIWEPIDFNEVYEAMHAFRVHVAVIDCRPETRIARAFAAEFPGRVFLAEYDETLKDAWRLDEKRNMVKINRTEAIDAMMDSIRHVSNIPNNPPPANYFDQMKSPKRRIVEDTKGRPRRVYVSTGSQGDDYAHAEVYDLMASDLMTALNMAGKIHDEGEPEFVTQEPAPVRLGWGNTDYDPGFGG